MSMAHITWINSNNFFVVYNPRIGAYTFQTILSKADLIICQKSGFGNLMEPYLWMCFSICAMKTFFLFFFVCIKSETLTLADEVKK
ncbi:uncharacterized protein OCT59_003269 [Rhizophagus irregularis]|uniref:uncharacterized protein n=1 Tax=Rhizophagus irregularis TaxID=588596 RepID=UPI0033344AB6|nr:hypothetical protein OCT59_003269 [Rhizophagus irregularis]